MATSRNWSTLMANLVPYVKDAHEWTDYRKVEISGRECNVQIKGRFHKLEWVWDGRCECGGIVGSAHHCKSREGASQNAIQDYITKARQAGLITP